jgi:hypothetical protein
MIKQFADLQDPPCHVDSSKSWFHHLWKCIFLIGHFILAAYVRNQDQFIDQCVMFWGICCGLYRANKLGWCYRCFLFAKSRSALKSVEIDWFEVIPQRLAILATEGPTNSDLHRCVDPCERKTILIDKLTTMNVATLVCLGERQYEDKEFEDRSITCVSCEYDTEIPPPSAITSFLFTLRSCAKKGSMVAVYCNEESTRCGILCALHLMEAHGFDAGAACGWLRIVCRDMDLGVAEADYLNFVGSQADGADMPPDARIRRGAFRAWRGGITGEEQRARPESAYDPHDCVAVERSGAAEASAWSGEGWREGLEQPATLADGDGDGEDAAPLLGCRGRRGLATSRRNTVRGSAAPWL